MTGSLTPATRDIQVLKTYGAAPYGAALKKLEQQIKEKQQSVDEKIGVKVREFSLPRTTSCYIRIPIVKVKGER